MNLNWTDSCCAEATHWTEFQQPTGEWVRLKRKIFADETSGKTQMVYMLTQFTEQKSLLAPEREVSLEELQQLGISL